MTSPPARALNSSRTLSASDSSSCRVPVLSMTMSPGSSPSRRSSGAPRHPGPAAHQVQADPRSDEGAPPRPVHSAPRARRSWAHSMFNSAVAPRAPSRSEGGSTVGSGASSSPHNVGNVEVGDVVAPLAPADKDIRADGVLARGRAPRPRLWLLRPSAWGRPRRSARRGAGRIPAAPCGSARRGHSPVSGPLSSRIANASRASSAILRARVAISRRHPLDEVRNWVPSTGVGCRRCYGRQDR